MLQDFRRQLVKKKNDMCAPAYVFLASEDSSYMTGQVVHINGGEVVNG